MIGLITVAAGIAALLILVLKLRIPAFLALLLVSAGVGLALGMDTAAVLKSIRDGMGGTLGFIAIVVGLGAMFGALLEYAGGVRTVAQRLLAHAGGGRTPWALSTTGLVIGIPVFFDVAFILLVPLIHQLAARSGRPAIYYAIPLLAGLLVGHAFIPPTPGPVAVAELLEVDLGWVIVMGLVCGVPATIVAGPLFARRFLSAPAAAPAADQAAAIAAETSPDASIGIGAALFAVALPLVLILGNTAGGLTLPEGPLRTTLAFVGHPFIALLLACAYAYLVFGVRRRVPLERLREVMTKALEPAGVVVLITGAGGVFKQVLIDSGTGDLIGAFFAEQAVPPMLFAFAFAALIRVAQGSATVAMITSAGLTAPILQHLSLSAPETALVAIAIASGASLCSHVNDSGFWLVNHYLRQTEAETLRSWTVLSTLAGITGFVVACGVAVLL